VADQSFVARWWDLLDRAQGTLTSSGQTIAFANALSVVFDADGFRTAVTLTVAWVAVADVKRVRFDLEVITSVHMQIVVCCCC